MPTREILYDEVFDAQKHFRVLLDAMSRPGKIGRLEGPEMDPPPGIHRASILSAFALLNADVSFFSFGDPEGEIAQYIQENTGAQCSDMETADYVFLRGVYPAESLFKVKKGSLQEPEESATVLVDLERISVSGDDADIRLVLQGPGVETEKIIFLKGVHAGLFGAIAEINDEFPMGIDLFVADADQQVMGIPRSCHFVFETV